MLDVVQEIDCDVLIVGGGINGCSIAADAASRGLKVVLCEQNDLGNATSSASSKLIHGGLRYLEQYDFSMVRKALKERELLFKLCPYLIRPLAFVLPHLKTHRPFWLIRIGLFMYDYLCKTHLPKTKAINRKSHPVLFEALQSKTNNGFQYYDGQTIDCRLVILNALQAQKHNATILTRSQFTNTERNNDYWLSTLNNNTSKIKVKSKILVNATGPWADLLTKQLNINSPYHLSLVQGSHIVVNKLYEGDHAYILQNDDNRIVFSIPYHNEFTLIGTTDELFEDLPEKCKITNAEVNYLLQTMNNYFCTQLTNDDIKHTYCGLRPLIQDSSKNSAKDISRDYKILNENSKAPYICIYGGKLTTYRQLAKECIDGWYKHFPNLRPCKTDKLTLPGSDFKDLETLEKNLKCSYSQLPEELLSHYLSLYGNRTFILLENCTDLVSLGQFFGKNLYQVEVDFLIKHEWAVTYEDILWRRTKQGLFMNDAQIKRLKVYIQEKIK